MEQAIRPKVKNSHLTVPNIRGNAKETLHRQKAKLNSWAYRQSPSRASSRSRGAGLEVAAAAGAEEEEEGPEGGLVAASAAAPWEACE